MWLLECTILTVKRAKSGLKEGKAEFLATLMFGILIKNWIFVCVCVHSASSSDRVG